MKFEFIDDWKAKFWSLWSIQLALFWGGVTGAVLGLAAFIDIFNPWVFLVLNIIGYAMIAFARVTKQPGVEDS